MKGKDQDQRAAPGSTSRSSAAQPLQRPTRGRNPCVNACAKGEAGAREIEIQDDYIYRREPEGPTPMLVTVLETVLALIGIGLITLGIYGIVRNKFSRIAETTAFEVKISLPLAGWMVIFGLSGLGFAVYLAANGTAKSPVAAYAGSASGTVIDSSAPTNSPTPAISASSPAPAASTSPTPTAGTPTAGTPSVMLATPTTGTKVSASKGFPVEGTNSSLGPDTIWILDYDGGSTYTVDEVATTFNGQWNAFDGPGLGTDPLPFPLIMAVVLADPACNTTLNQHSGPNNFDISSLPPGCKVVAEVKVDVSRP